MPLTEQLLERPTEETIGELCKLVDGRPVFTPSTTAQREFIECSARRVIFTADAGHGKTVAGCGKAHLFASKYRKARCLILRATAVSCRSTTRETYRRKLLGTYLFDQRWQESKHRIVYPHTDAEVIFAGLDDPSSWQSGEYDFAFLDEIIPNLAGGRGISENEWDAVALRLRGNAPWHQLAGACNAGPSKHWILNREKSGQLLVIRGKPGENDAYLPSDYRSTKAGMRGVMYRRYVLNEWVSPEGAVFDEFDAAIHALRSDIDPPDATRILFGIDFGFNHPFSCIFAYKAHVAGETQWRIFDQVFGGRGVGDGSKPTEDWARIINSRWTNTTFLRAYADHSPGDQVTLRKYAPRLGAVVNADKKSERARIDFLKGLFARRLSNGEPAILIHPRCVALIDELESLQWKATQGGDILDVPTDVKNDSIDSLGYALFTDTQGIVAEGRPIEGAHDFVVSFASGLGIEASDDEEDSDSVVIWRGGK